PGGRVADGMTQCSSAEFGVVPAWQLVRLPESVDVKLGAAIMLQGMTAQYLTHSTFNLKRGQTAVVHAGAGGVGLLLIQIAKKLAQPCSRRSGMKPKRSWRVAQAPTKSSSIPSRILKPK